MPYANKSARQKKKSELWRQGPKKWILQHVAMTIKVWKGATVIWHFESNRGKKKIIRYICEFNVCNA